MRESFLFSTSDSSQIRDNYLSLSLPHPHQFCPHNSWIKNLKEKIFLIRDLKKKRLKKDFISFLLIPPPLFFEKMRGRSSSLILVRKLNGMRTKWFERHATTPFESWGNNLPVSQYDNRYRSTGIVNCFFFNFFFRFVPLTPFLFYSHCSLCLVRLLNFQNYFCL